MFAGHKGAQVQTLWPRLAPAASGGHVCGPWSPPGHPGPAGGAPGLEPPGRGARSVGLGATGGGVWPPQPSPAHQGSGHLVPTRESSLESLSPQPSAGRCFLSSCRPQRLRALEPPVPLSRLGQAAPRAPRGGDTRGKWATGVDGCEQDGVASVGLQM